MGMLRRCLILLFASLLAIFPLFGLAAQGALDCAHCPKAVVVGGTHCHQHATDSGQHHQCAHCGASFFSPCLQSAMAPSVEADKAVATADYLPAHFYHLTSPPPERPPSSNPA